MHKMAANTKEFWNSEFDKGAIYGLYPSETALKTATLLVKRGIVGPEFKLLEIGGGYGRNSKYFSEQLGVSVAVVDFSEKGIELGRKLVKGQLNPPKFILGDAKILENHVEPSSYDVVFHNFCLHLSSEEERGEIYRSVYKILKRGGLFIGSYLSVDDLDCPERDSEDGVTLAVKGKQQHFFTQKEIENEIGPYFSIDKINRGSDPEKIIDDVRNTEYYFLVGRK